MDIGTPDTSRPQALRVVTRMRARVAADRAPPDLGWVGGFCVPREHRPSREDFVSGHDFTGC